MRNNNPDIKIKHLIARNGRKKEGFYNESVTFQKIKERELRDRKISTCQRQQHEREKNGEYVIVEKGLSIFIKNGEDREKKISDFKKKISNTQKCF
jgi:hypothetical protein